MATRNSPVCGRRAERVQTIEEAITAFLADSKNRKKATTYSYEEHSLRHVARLIGDMMRIEVGWRTVVDYQGKRFEEKAKEVPADAPAEIREQRLLSAGKSINEEVRLLLQVLEDQGDEIRLKLKREKKLKLRQREGVGIALNLEQEVRLLAAAEATKQRDPDGTFNENTRCAHDQTVSDARAQYRDARQNNETGAMVEDRLPAAHHHGRWRQDECRYRPDHPDE